MKKTVIGIFTRKTQFKNSKLATITVHDGKIDFNFLKSIIEMVKERIGSMEFNKNSRNTWIWNNVSIEKIINLFTASPRNAAMLRGQIISPQIPREIIRLYLANAIEVPVESLDENQPVTGLTLPVCGKEKNSYLTTVFWCEEFFQKRIPVELIERGTVGQLIDFLQKN